MSIFSELVNPITPVGAGSRGSAMGNGLGDAAEFVETLRKNRAAEAHQAEQDRLKEQHQIGTDRYYDSLSKYHEGLVAEQGANRKQKELDAQQKQLGDLITAHSKAIGAGQLDVASGIRQQIEGLGLGKVSEEETRLPGQATAAPSPGAPAPSLTPPPPGAWTTLKNGQDEPHAPGYGEGETPPPTAGPAPFLKDYMASQGVAAQTAPSPAASSSLTLLPSPTDITAPPAGPPKRKERYVVKNPQTGAVISEFDAPVEQEKNRAAVAAIIAPMTQGGTPEADAAWKQVGKSAEQMVQAEGITPKEAVDRALKLNEGVLGQFKKRYAGGGGAGTPKVDGENPGGKAEVSRRSEAEKETLANIKNVVSADKYSAMITSARELDHGEALLNSGNGFAERSALIAWVKGMNGRGSAQEYKTIIGSGSHWHNLITEIQKFKDGAPLSSEFVENARKAMAEVRTNLDREVNDASEKAGEQVADSLTAYKGKEREQQVERAKKFFKPKGATVSQAPAGTGNDDAKKKRLAELAARLGQ